MPRAERLRRTTHPLSSWLGASRKRPAPTWWSLLPCTKNTRRPQLIKSLRLDSSIPLPQVEESPVIPKASDEPRKGPSPNPGRTNTLGSECPVRSRASVRTACALSTAFPSPRSTTPRSTATGAPKTKRGETGRTPDAGASDQPPSQQNRPVPPFTPEPSKEPKNFVIRGGIS